MKNKGILRIVGIGPGDSAQMSLRACAAIKEAEVVIGYKTYLQCIRNLAAGKNVFSTGMAREKERAEFAISEAKKGKNVCLISSGDAGVFGMAGLVFEILSKPRPFYNKVIHRGKKGRGKDDSNKIAIEVVPGIMALNSCASLIGAPLMNDFALISLSDLLTGRALILRRLKAAIKGDFVIVFYNPKSQKRTQLIKQAWKILMEHRAAATPVGIVRNGFRQNQEVTLTTLKDMLKAAVIDMRTTIIIGNSKTYCHNGRIITPRGYEL